MDRQAIAERLRALASDDSHRSMAARLRDVIDDVEAALSKGVSRSAVVDVLRSSGIELTLSGFDSTMRRIRKKRKRVNTAPVRPASPPPLPPSPQPHAMNAEPPDSPTDKAPTASHNPADLNSILNTPPDLTALAKLGKKDKK